MIQSLSRTQKITRSALLIALAIVIPIVMPKISIPPASYTIASHVPVFISMFISPGVAIMVTLGTALGFFFTLPFIVSLRALSHLIFAVIGAVYIKKFPDVIYDRTKVFFLNLVIALIHAISESIVVALFFLVDSNQGNINYFITLFLMIGVGGFFHSIIDFFITQHLLKRLNWIKY